MEWSLLREQIRRTILLDTNTERPKWSNDVLRDTIWWALDSLCAHTAAVSSVTLPADGSTTYDLPENVFVSPAEAGSVYVVRGLDYSYYGRFMVDHDLSIQQMFDITPDNKIRFMVGPQYDVTLRYYAYYNHPWADTDIITVPQWALPAIGYLAASYAVAGQAVKTGNIRQYSENPDRGDPEDNPFIQQASFFQQTYYSILKRYKPQERHFYRGER